MLGNSSTSKIGEQKNGEEKEDHQEEDREEKDREKKKEVTFQRIFRKFNSPERQRSGLFDFVGYTFSRGLSRRELSEVQNSKKAPNSAKKPLI